MAIREGDRVELFYTGRFETGGVFDSNLDKEPFSFTAGAGQVIEGFDKAVIGMEAGEKREFTVSPEAGYGPTREDLVFEFDREMLGCDGAKEGDCVMLKTARGNGINVLIKSIREDKVIVDANHPLAGKTLVFDIKIIDFSNE